MNCRIENGMILFDIDGKKYSFKAHGIEPRQSLLDLGISAGEKHWSSRDPEVKLEKHTSIQDVDIGNGLVSWYTQEFVPDGLDYNVSKKSKLYIGDFETGEEKLIYEGECYGDLCFNDKDLYFNTGNKVAVIDTISGECLVLFKYSGIEKNRIHLNITHNRIYYIHWTHNSHYFMWYDRTTKEIINPHIDIGNFFFLVMILLSIKPYITLGY